MRCHRSRNLIRNRVVSLALVAFGTACSDGTGPSETPGGWAYRPAVQGAVVPGTDSLDAGLLALTANAGTVLLVIDPESGREKCRIASAGVNAAYRAGSVAVLLSGVTPSTATYSLHDAETGRLLFVEANQSSTRRFFATVGTTLIGALGDSVLTANDRSTGRELWRRAVAGGPCAPACGAFVLIDAIGDGVMLYRSSNTTAELVSVSETGTVTRVPTAREAFRGSDLPSFAKRSTAVAPVVIATSRAVTSLDPSTGATNWQVQFSAIAPAGFFTRAVSRQFTRNGAWLTVRLSDSTGVAAQPVRDLTIRASDGQRTRDRALTAEEANDLADGPCAANGRVRALGDLRLEFTDVASGASRTSAPIPTLSALRDQPIATGSLRASRVTTEDHIIFFDALTPRLTAIGCRV